MEAKEAESYARRLRIQQKTLELDMLRSVPPEKLEEWETKRRNRNASKIQQSWRKSLSAKLRRTRIVGSPKSVYRLEQKQTDNHIELKDEEYVSDKEETQDFDVNISRAGEIPEPNEINVEFERLEAMFQDIAKLTKEKSVKSTSKKVFLSPHEKYQELIELRGRTESILSKYHSSTNSRWLKREEIMKTLKYCDQMSEFLQNVTPLKDVLPEKIEAGRELKESSENMASSNGKSILQLFLLAKKAGVDVKTQFDKLDKRGNGTLTRENLYQSIRNLGGEFENVTKVQADALLSMFDKELDLEEDVEIDYASLLRFVLVNSEEVELQQAKSLFEKVLRETKKDVRLLFDSWDSDKDGRLTTTEFGLALKEFTSTTDYELISECLAPLMGRLDENGDGEYISIKVIMKTQMELQSNLLQKKKGVNISNEYKKQLRKFPVPENQNRYDRARRAHKLMLESLKHEKAWWKVRCGNEEVDIRKVKPPNPWTYSIDDEFSNEENTKLLSNSNGMFCSDEEASKWWRIYTNASNVSVFNLEDKHRSGREAHARANVFIDSVNRETDRIIRQVKEITHRKLAHLPSIAN